MRMPLIFALCLVGFAAQAQVLGPDIPTQDVDRACGRLQPALTVSQCVRSEQDSYDFVRTVWPSLPAKRRSFCIDQSADQLGKPFYYMTLASHVQAQVTSEQIQRDRVLPPRFRP